MKLEGKVALITGGAQGIGRATALAMAREGAAVAIVDVQLEKAEATAAEVEQLGARALVLHGDVSDSAAVSRMFQECTEKLGPVDILVNAAAIGGPRGIDISEEAWDRVLAVNLKSMFLTCRVALPGMVERGWGRVINFSSTAAYLGHSIGDVPYAAAKGGVVGFTRTVARLVADKGVTVNVMTPGPIDTGLATGRRVPGEWEELTQKKTPTGRAGRPEEVAEAVLFLASPGASYVNGATMNVSGGYLMY